MLGILSLTRRPTLDQLGPLRGREEMRRQAGLAALPTGPLERVEDRTIAGPGGDLGLRIYTPRSPWAAARPALLYLHGGGFVLGDLDSHDGLCRFFAERAGVVVVAVDYRLAPEHPFPAAVDDALAAYRWLREAAPSLSIDPTRIAVGGDSAGGNLAAVLTQQLLAHGEPLPAFQLLIYPATDLSRSFDSHRTFAEGFYLERPTIDWFLAN
jgi:acetyl esterase